MHSFDVFQQEMDSNHQKTVSKMSDVEYPMNSEYPLIHSIIQKFVGSDASSEFGMPGF